MGLSRHERQETEYKNMSYENILPHLGLSTSAIIALTLPAVSVSIFFFHQAALSILQNRQC